MSHLPAPTPQRSKAEHRADHAELARVHNLIHDKAEDLLTKTEADARYALLGAVGGVIHNHDLAYAALAHSHNYAATGHTHNDYPAPSDGTPATIADAGSAGNGAAYARWNHVHGKGTHDHPHNHDAAYAAADHTHAGSGGGVTVARAAADQAFTTVTLANVTGLSFAVSAYTGFEFEFLLAITSAATATGWQFGFTGPASPAAFVAVCEYQSSATAWTVQTLTAVGAFPLVTAAYVANLPIVVRIKGVISTGAAAGSVQLQARSEVAGSAVTVKRGSTLKVA